MPLSIEQKKIIKTLHGKQHSIKEISTQINADTFEVKKYIESLQLISNPGKKWIYNLIALLIPVIFLLLLEGILQIFEYGGELDLFVNPSREAAKFKMCNPYIGRRYFSSQSIVPDPSNDLFLSDKPENCYRIFVIGGSTAAGYPYQENLMFSRILNQRLSEVFPEKRIEVVNTATAAINSYTLLDFMDEILDNQPDALLIYAGHNEFYGALGVASTESLGKFRWAIRLYLKLEKYRTFILIRDGITNLQKWMRKVFYEESISDPTATLMERMVAEQKIAFKSPVYKMGKRQFRENLNEILKKATNAGVKVLISELVSNIRDQKPFESIKTEEFPPANKVFETAEALEKEGNYGEAYQEYYLAKDLDALRFRATEEFNDIIHKLSNKYKIPVVPMKFVFEAASPHGLIGNNLMLEHLHPNIEGYFLISDAFFHAMEENGFISAVWDKERIKSNSNYREHWGFTDLDSLYGDFRIRLIKGGWPFKPKSVINRTLLDYHPSTKAESLVVKMASDRRYLLDNAHLELGDYFMKRKEYLRAYKEFNALICLKPFGISCYLEAAKALIEANEFDRVLSILYKSLEIGQTVYANKWIGQILLNDGFAEKSLPYLKKAYQMNSADTQVLYNLSGAYALNAQYLKAKETLDELWVINPNFPDAAILKRQLDHILKN